MEWHQVARVGGYAKTARTKRHLDMGILHHEHDPSVIKRGCEFLYYVGTRDGGSNLSAVYFKTREDLKVLITELQQLYDEGPNVIDGIKYQKAVKDG